LSVPPNYFTIKGKMKGGANVMPVSTRMMAEKAGRP